MREFAEITCLTCGRDLGAIERVEKSVRYTLSPSVPTTAKPVRKGKGLACGHCGGRALIGSMERAVTYAA